MDLNSIKKELYKQKPKARFLGARKGTLHYIASIGKGPEHRSYFFHIPIGDMGEASFEPEMESKHLIRWLVMPINSTQ